MHDHAQAAPQPPAAAGPRVAARRLLLAAAISFAAHAVLLAGSWITPPDPAPALPPLTARLEPLPPLTAPPAPAASAIRPRPATPPRRTVATVPRPAPPVAAPTIVALPEESAALTVESVAEPAPVISVPVITAHAPATFRMPDPPPLPEFPRKGRITYLLTMGAEQTPVGHTVQNWEFSKERYRLGSQSESTGLIELFRPHRFHYLSQGALSDRGLQPERFLASVQRGNRIEESLAVFDWAAGRVRLGRIPQQDTVALPAGSQDLISFMYQLALAPPPPGRLHFPFTRGRKLEQASFDILQPETIETPLGRLRTIPVIQVREAGSESLAVWLATDYRNLPVRIRFYNRDGEPSGEQLVTEIHFSEE